MDYLKRPLHKLHHDGHQSGADTSGHGQSDAPREHDVAEDAPVDVIARAYAADEHDAAHLAVRRADRNADVWRDQNGNSGADLNAEPAETGNE